MSDLLPISIPEVYWAELYIDSLFNSSLSKRIKLVTNQTSTSCDELYYDAVSTGNFEAISFGKVLENQPSHWNDIPLNVISKDIILSRQLIGTTFKLVLVSIYPDDVIFNLMEGVIGDIKFSDLSCNLELVSENEKLKTPNPFKVTQDCMNSLGQLKCTVDNLTTSYFVTNISDGNLIQISSPSTIVNINSSDQYELEVGTTKYIIDKANSTTNIIKIVGRILGKPQLVTIRKHCNGTIQQCLAYNNLKQFNGNPFLKTSIINTNV
jgi:hypothetical protein